MERMARAEATHSLRCAGCNAPVTWNPGEAAVACAFCDETQAVEAAPPPPPEVALADFEASADRASLGEDRRRLECGRCGASLDFEGQHARRCDFCGASAVEETAAAGTIAPSAIAPFVVTREQAAEAYRKWVDERPFVPGPVRNGVPLDEMRGLYVPFWTFDLTVQRWFKCWAGYVEGHVVDNIGGKREVNWLWRKGWNEFPRKNLAICASRGLPTRLREAFEPFDMRGVRAYDAAYLSGFVAEAAAASPTEAWQTAEALLDREQHRQVRKDELADADYIKGLSLNRDYLDVKVRLVYLPMWVAAYRFSGRVFRFVVDGRTGKATGDIPWSKKQVAVAAAVGAAVLAISAAVAAPILLEILRPDPAAGELHAPAPLTLPP
jgi:hypothetical protein